MTTIALLQFYLVLDVIKRHNRDPQITFKMLLNNYFRGNNFSNWPLPSNQHSYTFHWLSEQSLRQEIHSVNLLFRHQLLLLEGF